MNSKIITWAGSNVVTATILILFAVMSILIAVKSPYPLSFDEGYHFALINHYSDHISPFISQQTAELNVMGDATRLGSYLYHYLTSFPYRVAELFIADAMSKIIFLRILNVIIAVAFLLVTRALLNRITKSPQITNLSILVYVCLPVTTFLAAHINYDNLLLLGVAVILLLTHVLVSHLHKERAINYYLIGWIFSLSMLLPLVKFTSLPIVLVIGISVIWLLFKYKSVRQIRLELGKIRMSITLIGLLVLCAASFAIFAERYVGNLVQYGTPQPDCLEVQPLSVCRQYPPWERNYLLAQAAPHDTLFEGRSFGGYVAHLWIPMMSKGFGYTGQEMRVYDAPRMHDYIIGLSLAGLGLGVAFITLKMIRSKFYLIVIAATFLYFGILIHRNFTDFMDLHALIAVQGRYALPIIMPFIAYGLLGLVGMGAFVKRLHSHVSGLWEFTPEEAYRASKAYWSLKARNWHGEYS